MGTNHSHKLRIRKISFQSVYSCEPTRLRKIRIRSVWFPLSEYATPIRPEPAAEQAPNTRGKLPVMFSDQSLMTENYAAKCQRIISAVSLPTDARLILIMMVLIDRSRLIHESDARQYKTEMKIKLLASGDRCVKSSHLL